MSKNKIWKYDALKSMKILSFSQNLEDSFGIRGRIPYAHTCDFTRGITLHQDRFQLLRRALIYPKVNWA